jgi:HAD superfamily hydrolase (TIGR01490 family)
MPSKRNVIAAFDLDGTLTSRDTFADLVHQVLGFRKLAAGIFVNSPLLLKYLFRLTSRHAAKEAMFGFYFRGWRAEEFDAQCRTYSTRSLPRLMKGEALSRCDWHKRQGHTLVCVSASIRNWIAPWALHYGFHQVIATEIETDGGVVTGRFDGRNCDGPEKVRRFLEAYPERDLYTLFAYGDSRGDEALLSLADRAYLRRFD